LHDVAPVLVTVVFENGDKVSPPDFGFVPCVFRGFQHPFDVKILNEYGIILGGAGVCEFVLVIVLFVRHPHVNIRDVPPLFLPVVRLVGLSRE
jgi:hypothetical protein